MQHTDHEPEFSDFSGHEPAPLDPIRLRRRLALVLSVILVLLLLAIIPPLINVSRFQRRISTSISASLGRPVHFDRVNLTLLPLPGFTLENFVVEEDPAFGYEPILRADEVRVTLRISSLWRGRPEFSRISLTDPSLNLVHTSAGRWNTENLFLQASRIEAAPTAQRHAGPAPRFPYIEATGARINLKLDQAKTPFYLADADFALWLPEPRQWHLRLETHPARTDAAYADTGTLRIEGTLGSDGAQAATLAQVPVDLHLDWRDVQLGGLTSVLLGHDSGLRGDLSVTGSLAGTLGQNTIATRFQLAHARRADFVPTHLLSLDAACQASASDTFHAFTGIECFWPPAGAADRSIAILAADIPDTLQPQLSTATFTVPGLPVATVLDWLSVATQHPPTAFAPTGSLGGSASWNPGATATNSVPTRPGNHTAIPAPQAALTGEFDLSGAALQLRALGPDPIPLGDVALRSAAPATPAPHPHAAGGVTPQTTPQSAFDLLPISIPLGGKQPATLEAHFTRAGYTLHLSGNVLLSRLYALADAIPQLGSGLRDFLTPNPPESAQNATISPAQNSTTDSTAPASTELPTHIDITATRPWGGPQTWHPTSPAVLSPKRHRSAKTRL